jgi:PAS domain S-box-containing protein
VYQFQRLPDSPPATCGRLLFMSAGARHLFDLAPDQSHTDFATILDAIAEEDRGALTAALNTAVKCTVEFRVRPRQPRQPHQPGQAGATERWLQLNAEPEPPLADGSQTWNGVIVDISEIKAVQHDLARSRNEWGATVDSVKDMIVLEDPQGRILRCNLATTQFLRASFQAVVGCDLGGAFYGTAATGAALPSFRVEHTTVQFPDHADWFEIANFPLHDAARRGASWVHVISNVSARRSSEEQARRLSAAIEQTGEMLLIVSRNGILQYANPAYCNAAGEAVELLIGKPAFQLPLAPRGSVRPIRACVLGGRVWRGMFPVAGPDGAMHEIEATVSPVRGEGGDTSSFVCVGRDVTEPRRLEAIADAANMVDQVGFVFATLRHELGNPINSLKTALSVLHRNLSDYSPEAVTHYLERSLAEIARMEYLLRAFKTFGAFERPQLEEVAASDFLADFARLVGPDLERRGIGLDTRIAPDLGLARLDPRAFNQALLNLVTNAADAVTGCQAPCVRIAAQRRGRRIEVRVEDNGVGVAEGDLPNLFKPFYSTKRGGTGLGLAIVRKLLSKMGSTIDVRSDRGIATVFTLSLPVAEAR